MAVTISERAANQLVEQVLGTRVTESNFIIRRA